jgi:hypothetical protein
MVPHFRGLKAEVAHASLSGLIRLFDCARNGDPTSAYLPVSNKSVTKAMVEVHWARKYEVPSQVKSLSILVSECQSSGMYAKKQQKN